MSVPMDKNEVDQNIAKWAKDGLPPELEENVARMAAGKAAALQEKTILIKIVGGQFTFQFDGLDPDEIPTKLRRAAHSLERELGA